MCASPERWKSSRTSCESRSSSPSTIPRSNAASGAAKPLSSPASALLRTPSSVPGHPAAPLAGPAEPRRLDRRVRIAPPLIGVREPQRPHRPAQRHDVPDSGRRTSAPAYARGRRLGPEPERPPVRPRPGRRGVALGPPHVRIHGRAAARAGLRGPSACGRACAPARPRPRRRGALPRTPRRRALRLPRAPRARDRRPSAAATSAAGTTAIGPSGSSSRPATSAPSTRCRGWSRTASRARSATCRMRSSRGIGSQTRTLSRSAASFLSPIPGTWSSSSTLPKPPWALR